MQTAIKLPIVPTGKVKSFGPFGLKYEVGKFIRETSDGDCMIEIIIVETGESTEYRLSHIENDPEAK